MYNENHTADGGYFASKSFSNQTSGAVIPSDGCTVRKRKKAPAKEVIILGCGPTCTECPWNECEIWGVNGVYTFAERLDRLFITDVESEVDACWYDYPEMAKLQPLLVTPIRYKRLNPLKLSVMIYPIQAVLDRFDTRFFSNTIAYMIALALYEGYTRIRMYGIDMMTNSTYVQEKGGVEYWMGVALGLGVEVINTCGSATGKSFNGRMYGYYGDWEEERMKESLYAPMDLVRGGKSTEPQIEWIKNIESGEFESLEPDLKGVGFRV